MNNQIRIDDKLCLIAEQVTELEGGQVVARELFALATRINQEIDDYHMEFRSRTTDAVAKLMDYYSGLNKIEVNSIKEGVKSDRRRIARLLAASEKWSGTYGDAMGLMEKEQ